jgi:citrate lyase subunit beta/citryl-CoA lyase
MNPAQALFDPEQRAVPALPVCDHYAGVEPRMTKSLQLQAELGPVFDVTLDNEDGAPVGREVEHARLIAGLLGGPLNRYGRVGVRLLPVSHPAFAEVAGIVLGAGQRPAYLMIPKPRGVACIDAAARTIDRLGGADVPLHALVETHAALAEVAALAAHTRIESLSFGLMDFVSAHRGAIPQWAMSAEGQFEHPLVVRAKLEIAAACHAHGKVPAHGVVTEFKDSAALAEAARKAVDLLGFTRMWSIHPSQVRTIVAAFAPAAHEVAQAVAILQAAEAADWAPIRYQHGHHDSPHGGHQDGQADTLHDRASYRYFWQVLQRAERTRLAGAASLPEAVRKAWFDTGAG